MTDEDGSGIAWLRRWVLAPIGAVVWLIDIADIALTIGALALGLWTLLASLSCCPWP